MLHLIDSELLKAVMYKKKMYKKSIQKLFSLEVIDHLELEAEATLNCMREPSL